MYAEHQLQIGFHLQRHGFAAFQQIAAFVLATIRCDLPTAAIATLAVAGEGSDINNAVRRAFFGSKLKGMEFLGSIEGYKVYREAHMRENQLSDTGLIEILLQIPGLGLAKAGFLAQLCWGRVGCLDSHNVRRLGVDPKLLTVGARPKTEKGLVAYRERIARYVALCAESGGPEVLWDDWCDYVANRQPKRYTGPADVSLWHLRALGLRYVA